MAFITLELTREDLIPKYKDVTLKEIEIYMFKPAIRCQEFEAGLVLFNEDHDGVWDKDKTQLYNNPKMTKILKKRKE